MGECLKLLEVQPADGLAVVLDRLLPTGPAHARSALSVVGVDAACRPLIAGWSTQSHAMPVPEFQAAASQYVANRSTRVSAVRGRAVGTARRVIERAFGVSRPVARRPQPALSSRVSAMTRSGSVCHIVSPRSTSQSVF